MSVCNPCSLGYYSMRLGGTVCDSLLMYLD
jgi:hypothetical protein